MHLAAVLLAHIGGIPTQARFATPTGVGNVADQSFQVEWQDPNAMDATGQFDFYFQPSNVLPNAPLGSGDLIGTILLGGQAISVADTKDTLVWDTSQVPAGSYFVYEITTDTDMGIPPTYSMSPGVVTVRHPDDVLAPAVVVKEPDGISDLVADAYPIRFEASGQGPLFATVTWGSPDTGEPLQPLTADVPMKDLGSNLHEGCYLWDVTAKAQGYYFVRVEVRDPAGRVHSAYSRASFTVYRSATIADAGPAPSCGEPAAVDAGGLPQDRPPDCTCTAGSARSGAGPSGLVLVVFVIWGLAYGSRMNG